MENIIAEEGGSVERLLSSEVFMAWMIFIKLYFVHVHVRCSASREMRTSVSWDIWSE